MTWTHRDGVGEQLSAVGLLQIYYNGYTGALHLSIQEYTVVYNGIQEYTVVYNSIQEYTVVHNSIQEYTVVYNSIQEYTGEVYKSIQ